MIESIIIEFEKVTKYPLLDFMREYRDFMTNSFFEIEKYFGGETESIDNAHINALKKVTTDAADVLAQFKNFSNKFNKCGYWELMDFIDDLNNTIEKVNKLPKFKRTVLGKRGYTNATESRATVGGFRTVEDVANNVNDQASENYGWVELMLNNDLNEFDWEIDKLSGLNVYFSKRQLSVSTIIDMPVGKRVYGVDVNRKIQFKDNDFLLVSQENNVLQKCDILLGLNQGDIPEYMLMGVNSQFLASNFTSYNVLEIIRQIQSAFEQNDLFEYATVSSIETDSNGNKIAIVKIKTKYEFSTEKQIAL